jgi:hypothetical protein
MTRIQWVATEPERPGSITGYANQLQITLTAMPVSMVGYIVTARRLVGHRSGLGLFPGPVVAQARAQITDGAKAAAALLACQEVGT